MESKLLSDLADQYRMDPKEFVAAVKVQCFKDGACSDAQLLLLLSVAKTYDLNPLIRELHAFVNKTGKMEIVVGVDGWFKIVARDARVLGWEDSEERDAKGDLIAVTVLIYRKDRVLADGRYLPGKYRALMDEWFVEHKGNNPATNWEEMPEHRLFGVSFKECARRTLGITEMIGEADAEKLERAETGVERVVTPVVEQPKVLNYQERIPANFTTSTREAVPVSKRPHLHVKLDEVVTKDGTRTSAGPPPPAENAAADAEERHLLPQDVGVASPAATLGQCQFKDCKVDAVERTETNFGVFNLCAEHASNYKGKKRGRPRDAGVAQQQSAGSAAPEVGGSVNVGASPTPRATVEAQRAAGLEKIDPNESSLETFIRVHDVPDKRINLFLAKKGVADRRELDDASRGELLGILRKSYGEVTT